MKGLTKTGVLQIDGYDAVDVRAYINSVIPFWRPGRRSAAMALVEKEPGLADRALMVACIPEAISSHANQQECWVRYETMLENWLKRERKWIQPRYLLDMAMSIAAELIINQQPGRSAGTLSARELADLLNLPEDRPQGWTLTLRSLLNRNAKGDYGFIHRTITEFLFVKAFINGNSACAHVAWTDTMRDFLLSWGRVNTDSASLDQAQRIFQANLDNTGLFPLPSRSESPVVVDIERVRDAFVDGRSATMRNDIPFQWRRHTSRHQAGDDMVRVYEFAEGKTWQWVKTKEFGSHADRLLYYTDRFEKRWGDHGSSEKTWGLPTLLELRSLLDVLAAHGLIDSYLDDQALYWIDDADLDFVCVVRVRTISQSQKEAYELPGWQRLHTVITQRPNAYIVDVYKTPTRGMAVSKAKALPIHTYRGDAHRLWTADQSVSRNDQRRDWGVRRLSPAPESIWLATL